MLEKERLRQHERLEQKEKNERTEREWERAKRAQRTRVMEEQQNSKPRKLAPSQPYGKFIQSLVLV